MFSIDKFNKISLTKGDNAEILVKIFYDDKTEYELQDGDSIVMTMKVAVGQEPVLVKTTTTNTILFVPTDTNQLNASLYVYDVQLLSNSRVYTIVPTSFFQLCGEVSV